jgi:hypothetical protein
MADAGPFTAFDVSERSPSGGPRKDSRGTISTGNRLRISSRVGDRRLERDAAGRCVTRIETYPLGRRQVTWTLRKGATIGGEGQPMSDKLIPGHRLEGCDRGAAHLGGQTEDDHGGGRRGLRPLAAERSGPGFESALGLDRLGSPGRRPHRQTRAFTAQWRDSFP